MLQVFKLCQHRESQPPTLTRPTYERQVVVIGNMTKTAIIRRFFCVHF